MAALVHVLGERWPTAADVAGAARSRRRAGGVGLEQCAPLQRAVETPRRARLGRAQRCATAREAQGLARRWARTRICMLIDCSNYRLII